MLNESNKNTCEYCNTILSTISSLNYHKKTNKKCLLLRDIEINSIFICSQCGFECQLKKNITIHKCRFEHIKIYKKYLDIINIEKDYKVSLEKIEKLKKKNILLKIELKEKLEKQENQLFTLASKPTNTSIKIQNLNNVLTSLDFKENSIKDKVDNNFTLEYLSEGIKGLAKFTKDHIINPSEDGKQKYICSDPSRAMFKYKDENGVIQKDVRATKLKNAIQEPIIKKTNTLISHETTRVREEGEEKFDITNTKLIDNLTQVRNLDDNGNEYAREMSLVC
jgi:hypothetical protein